ncbi:hypothetical protein [uncultured Thiohalocapsa sp.]|uniref:hypothetical protein n=1 Tax=uncultured Thiohalocapsa sp. TaxID=768990 RepID=UPI0025CCA937|nr:hypothetical protein [uncultured Thiohalocapsa sp.]
MAAGSWPPCSAALAGDAAPAAHGADQGPWESDTFAEDAKLSLGLLADGVASTYEPRARFMLTGGFTAAYC